MFIEEVIIDGFKSYATRTVVSGFDPAFNAITGLNGSGKSNILDSICFVLGISNLSQVRAGSLQELVYKQGQAGVTKASVTIVFNNSDKKVSPVGYEHFDKITVTRQVVIGGKNKYMVNAHTAQAGQVQNLFHSVQLNVNNPHFLIMQGRITKVLNMKPPEILGMIEEAAGTRMFENKKQSALKTIEKKQAKVDEINSILADEITPTLEKLRDERSAYLRWQQNSQEMERAERFVVAYDFVQAETIAAKSVGEIERAETELKELEDSAEALKNEVEEKKQLLNELAAKKEGELGSVFKAAKDEDEKLSKELVQLTSSLKNDQKTFQQEEKNLESLNQQVAEVEAQIEAKKAEIVASVGKIAQAEAVVTEKQVHVDENQRDYQNMCAGVASEKEDTQTLAGQIASAEEEANCMGTLHKQGEMRLKHLAQQRKELTKTLSAEDSQFTELKQKQEALKLDVSTIKERLGGLAFDETEEARLWDEKRQLDSAVSTLKDEVDHLEAQLAGRLAFQYQDPERNFDRSRVKGLVARLVRVSDPATTTALEVVAGGKLFQVVVDNEHTGKLLLDNGKLKRRVTIIPLNKISRNCVPQDKIRRAEEIAGREGGKVWLALELVGYDQEVQAAMENVFGTSLVCDRMDLAKVIAFDQRVRTKVVTLDGDSFEPAGTLTGGSRSGLGTLLQSLQQLSDANQELGARRERLRFVDHRLESISTVSRDFGDLRSQLELKEHALVMLEERVGNSQHAHLAQKLAEVEKELEELQVTSAEAAQKQKAAQQRVNTLKKEESSFRERRERLLGELETKVKEAKKDLAAAVKSLKDLQQASAVLELEATQLEEEKKTILAQAETATQSLAVLSADLAKRDQGVSVKREEYEAAHAKMEEMKTQLVECEKELKALSKEKDKVEKRLNNAEIEAKKLTHKVSRIKKDGADAQKCVDLMIEKYPWIQQERQFFGRQQTDYDFNSRNPSDTSKRLKELQQEQQNLSKKINKKVISMIDRAESEYEELMHKRAVVEKDKRKIQAVIEDLDIKKNQQLQTTWVKVNRDFGTIFSTLLPGTSAKLDPPEGGSVLDGLEVKVAFGNVWKESLAELSGGQRSLLALSLILALLLFKPAPMYILDEVDAALDLSHTQNIGTMLKTHFSNSQFIVVSLKEGMFNNANVIFR